MSWQRPPPRVKQWDGPVPGPRASRPALAAAVPSLCQPIQKGGRFESEAWRRAVASLPCVLCGREGDTQCAHRNEGKGMSQKTDDSLTAAVCSACHREIDQGKTLTREERRARMDKAILLTIRALARDGRLWVR